MKTSKIWILFRDNEGKFSKTMDGMTEYGMIIGGEEPKSTDYDFKPIPDGTTIKSIVLSAHRGRIG